MFTVRHRTWQYLIDWCSVMAERYGSSTCWEKETEDLCAKQWDWGQAMCRLAYGRDWMNHPDFARCNEISPEESAPQELMAAAKEWEGGKEPDWFDKSKYATNPNSEVSA